MRFKVSDVNKAGSFNRQTLWKRSLMIGFLANTRAVHKEGDLRFSNRDFSDLEKLSVHSRY
jgi:hypothetical protein